MFLQCFQFLAHIMSEWLHLLFNITLDSTTSITYGMLFVAVIFVVIVLRYLFEGLSSLRDGEDYGLKYVPKHEYHPKHERK